MRAEPAPFEEPRSRRSARARPVTALGPVTMFAGVVWALAQPYRISVMHPGGHDFWSLLVEPPLLVVLVGLLFSLCVAPGLLEDLEEDP